MSSLRKNQAYRLQGKQAGGRMTGRRDLACQAHLGPDARIAFDELHSTGDLPGQGSDPCLLHWQADFFTTEPPGKPEKQNVNDN